MLCVHPRLWIPPECGFAQWWSAKYADWNQSDVHSRRLEQWVIDLFSSRKFDTWKLEQEDVRNYLLNAEPGSYEHLVSSVYRLHALSNGKHDVRWGDKNNYYLNHIDELANLFPSAQFVHIVRDCRDVACSRVELATQRLGVKYAPKFSSLVADSAIQWAADMDKIEGAFKQFDPTLCYELHYEDLVTRPDKTLKEVCAFLGEKFDPAMLNFHEENRRSQLEPREFLVWKEKTLQPVSSISVGRFESELSDSDKDVVKRFAGDQLRRHGYI